MAEPAARAGPALQAPGRALLAAGFAGGVCATAAPAPRTTLNASAAAPERMT